MRARIATYRGTRSDDPAAFLPELAAAIERDLGDLPPGLEGLREIFVLDRAHEVERYEVVIRRSRTRSSATRAGDAEADVAG